MGKYSEAALKIKRLRSALSQGEFAQAIGVPRSKVSECERGKPPSVQMLVLLGNEAARQGLYNEAIWFWKRAKLDTEAMLMSASRLLAKRSASTGIAQVPLMPNIAGQEKAQIARVLQLDRSVVPHEEETNYLRVTDESFVPRTFHAQDIIVIDSFETDPWKLEGSLIAAYRSSELRDEKLQREFEKSNTKKEVEERRGLGIHPFQRFGLFVGRLQAQRVENNVHLYLTEMSRDGVEVREQIAFWSDYYLRRDPADRTHPDLKILGMILSSFPSSMPEPLRKESAKG